MPQIKDLSITKTTAGDGDFLIMQSPDGETYNITKSDLLAGSSSGNTVLWSPPQLSTDLWLDSNDPFLISTDEASLVSKWIDRSGNSRHLTQSNNALKPLLVPTGLNNKPVLIFDGSGNYLRASTTFNYGSNISLFFVAKYNDSNRKGLFDSAPNSANTLRNLSNNSFEWWDGSPSLAIDCAVGEFEILNFNYKLAPNRIIDRYINGGNYASASNGNGTAAAWANFTIGGVNTSEASFNGSIAEVILFTSVLSTSVRERIEGYLAWKWGLVSKLPISHPYKNNTPT